MSVTVKHLNDSNLGTAETTHDDGMSFDVRDGHLFVTGIDTGGFTTNVAVYAPSKWIKAFVDGK